MASINRDWNQVFDSIQRTNFKIRSALAQALAALNVTPVEVTILLAVDEANVPPSLTDISRKLVSDTPPSRLAKGLRVRSSITLQNSQYFHRSSVTVNGLNLCRNRTVGLRFDAIGRPTAWSRHYN